SIFGDIFLEDLRKYREDKLSQMGLTGLFPLWQRPTKEIISEFIDLGFKTITTCVNEKFLDKSFAGRIIDHQFLNDLPANVDPCGENGEFHTFVFDGPLFKKPISFEKGDMVYRRYTNTGDTNNNDVCKTDDPFDTGFFYCDLLPA
ncbi:MAG: Dph6-related ATP pyrophosphatase, partial [Bacteroidia bacterium]